MTDRRRLGPVGAAAGATRAARTPARIAAAGWGIAAVIVYLAAGALTWTRVPPRLLFEGEAPPAPYRWVRPPAALAGTNERPEPGTGTVTFTPAGSGGASILTGDGQAGIIFPHNVVAPRDGGSPVRVTITPLDPGAWAPPPRGLRFDGNAYRFDAAYASGAPVDLRGPVTPVLRYPRHATILLRSTDHAWTALNAKRVEASLQIFAASDRLGVFVAAAPTEGITTSWLGYAAVGAGALAVIAGAAAAVLARRRRPGVAT